MTTFLALQPASHSDLKRNQLFVMFAFLLTSGEAGTEACNVFGPLTVIRGPSPPTPPPQTIFRI